MLTVTYFANLNLAGKLVFEIFSDLFSVVVIHPFFLLQLGTSCVHTVTASDLWF